MKNQYSENLIKIIQSLGYTHSDWRVFNDFLELSSLAIANCFNNGSTEWEKREKQYLEIIGKYSPVEQKLFTEMFANFAEALQYEITCANSLTDVLGSIFNKLELYNKCNGQFFTPQHICDMMGKIALGENMSAVNEHGYISVCEPCCGSGAMVLGFARAMFDAKLNYNKQLIVTATDVDLKCVYMCYLQLSLYGIPAVVIHGNTITMEEWSHWVTPVYIINGWHLKR